MIDSVSRPAVSVIMSIHDSAVTIDAAVASLVRQTFADWELVLIDDGSRDGGADCVAKFADPRIRIIRHHERKGLASRLNEAVRLARGDIIARMDADDICYPERLDVQIRFLQSNPSVDLVASKALVFRGEGRILGVMSPPINNDEIMSRLYEGVVFPHPTWCGRAAWFRSHPYNERLPITQDQELLLRTAESSQFAGIDKILLGYRKERISLSKSARGRMLFCRSLWWHAQNTGARGRALVQIAKQLAKFAAEAVATGAGAEQWLLKGKLDSFLTTEETAKWRALWSDVCGTHQARPRMMAGNTHSSAKQELP